MTFKCNTQALLLSTNLCGSRKYPYSPLHHIGNSEGEVGDSKAKIFKGKSPRHEAKLELPQGEGMGIFWKNSH